MNLKGKIPLLVCTAITGLRSTMQREVNGAILMIKFKGLMFQFSCFLFKHFFKGHINTNYHKLRQLSNYPSSLNEPCRKLYFNDVLQASRNAKTDI